MLSTYKILVEDSKTLRFLGERTPQIVTIYIERNKVCIKSMNCFATSIANHTVADNKLSFDMLDMDNVTVLHFEDGKISLGDANLQKKLITIQSLVFDEIRGFMNMFI